VYVPEAGHDMAGGAEGAPQLGGRDGLPQRVLYPYVQHGRLVRRAVHRNHLSPHVSHLNCRSVYRYRSLYLQNKMRGLAGMVIEPILQSFVTLYLYL
jgi:hypothetical protein